MAMMRRRAQAMRRVVVVVLAMLAMMLGVVVAMLAMQPMSLSLSVSTTSFSEGGGVAGGVVLMASAADAAAAAAAEEEPEMCTAPPAGGEPSCGSDGASSPASTASTPSSTSTSAEDDDVSPRPAPPIDFSKAPDTTSFFAWLDASGAVYQDTVEYFHSPRFGSGLRAHADIKRGQLVMSVPLALTITVDTVRDSELSELLEDYSNTPATAIYLAIHSQRTDSPHAPWFSILPRNLPTPLFYGEPMFEELRGTNVPEMAKRRRDTAIKQWREMSPGLRRQIGTLQEFMWALSVLWSRSHTIAVRDAPNADWSRVSGFVPLADMMNMGNATEINVECRTDTASVKYECYASQPITAGQQLFASYGDKPNERLLLDYGFAILNNPKDVAVVPMPDYWVLTAKNRGDIRMRQDAVLRELGFKDQRAFEVPYPPMQAPLHRIVPPSLWAYARVASLSLSDIRRIPEAQMLAMLRSSDELSFSDANDVRAMRLIAKGMRLVLERFKDYIDVDVHYLNQPSLATTNPTFYSIVLTRFSQKSILHDIATSLEENAEELNKRVEERREQRRKEKAEQKRASAQADEDDATTQPLSSISTEASDAAAAHEHEDL